MTIEIHFPISPSNPTRKMAIELAEASGGHVSNGFMTIAYVNHYDPNLLKLAQLINHKKYISFSVNGLNCEPAQYINIRSCDLSNDCNGICHNLVGFVPDNCEGIGDSAEIILQELISNEPFPQLLENESYEETDDESSKPDDNIYPFIKIVAPDRYEIDKPALLNHILNRHFLESLFCSTFSQEKIETAINALPDNFPRKSRNNSRIDSGNDEESTVHGIIDEDKYYEEIELAKKVAAEIAPILARAVADELLLLLSENTDKDA